MTRGVIDPKFLKQYDCREIDQLQAELDETERANKIFQKSVVNLQAELAKVRQASCKYLEQTAKYKAELDEHRWIPVSERLPEFIGEYQTFDMTIGYEILYFDGVLWCEKDTTPCHRNSQERITHWKPIILPEGDNG